MLSKNAKWPKRSKRRKISALLCSILLISAIAGAAIVAPVPVFALSAGGIRGTIASIVLSLLLQTGTAPTNTAWLTSLNAAYGAESSIGTIEQCISNGLLTETAEGLVDTGLSAAIEAAPEYTSLGLDQLFTTLASDSGVNVASGAVNLANTARHVGKFGTIGAFAGAVAVGVGIGVLIPKVFDWIDNQIKLGLPMNTEIPFDDLSGYGTASQFRINAGGQGIKDYFCIAQNGTISAVGKTYIIVGNPTSTAKLMQYKEKANNGSWSAARNTNVLPGRYQYVDGSPFYGKLYGTDPSFSTDQEAFDYVQFYINNPEMIKDTISPDVITPLGNAQMIEGPNGADIINGQDNIVPEGYDMTPVDVLDYLNFADQANDNTQNGDTGQDIQGEAFDDFVDPYLVPPQQEPDEPIIPENPDIPTPEYPDRPIVPDQPTVPDKPDATPEDITDMTDMMTTPELKSVFPFCIPWDLYNLFHIFDTGENRRAPHIQFTFPGTDWHIDVDLAQFDPVAALLRLLELIAFIAGLAVATRALIGANG